MNRPIFAAMAAAAAMALAPSFAPAQELGRGSGTGLVVPVTGTVNGSTATGIFKIARFGAVNNEVRAFGTLTLNYGINQVALVAASAPVILPAAGAARTTASNNGTFAIGAAAPAATATCEILNLTLGPLDLNLLGLTIHLDRVVLNIGAEPGAGNLLGNLLCAVANLLNGVNIGNLLQQLVNALNALLGAL